MLIRHLCRCAFFCRYHGGLCPTCDVCETQLRAIVAKHEPFEDTQSCRIIQAFKKRRAAR